MGFRRALQRGAFILFWILWVGYHLIAFLDLAYINMIDVAVSIAISAIICLFLFTRKRKWVLALTMAAALQCALMYGIMAGRTAFADSSLKEAAVRAGTAIGSGRAYVTILGAKKAEVIIISQLDGLTEAAWLVRSNRNSGKWEVSGTRRLYYRIMGVGSSTYPLLYFPE